MVYKISEFAKIIGVSSQTLWNWDKEGILVANRGIKGHRFYTNNHLDLYKKLITK